MMPANKACPVVLRQQPEAAVLVFRHPLAGVQLVKGTIEAGEAPAAAALRELQEEAGIGQAWVEAELGLWDSGFQGQVWAFFLCQSDQPLAEFWTHHTEDGGGLDFAFFWQPLAAPATADWHPVYQRALAYIRQHCRT